MTLFIVGLSITLILNTVLAIIIYKQFWANQKQFQALKRGLIELQKEFTQYQVDERRVKGKDTARMEIRHDNIAKSIQKNEDRIHLINKTLPNKIGEIVSQIEFAQNKINKK